MNTYLDCVSRTFVFLVISWIYEIVQSKDATLVRTKISISINSDVTPRLSFGLQGY